ncbi:hypothetical protein CH252_20540 [Rhodococcus sp. 06-1477-1B]|nr:hypothetical protein CH252_20540 [Rhodococcus sp. 06-1477-1B]
MTAGPLRAEGARCFRLAGAAGEFSSLPDEITLRPRGEVRVAGTLSSVTDLFSSREAEAAIARIAGRAQVLAGEQGLEITRVAFGADSPIVGHLAGELDREPPSQPMGFRV